MIDVSDYPEKYGDRAIDVAVAVHVMGLTITDKTDFEAAGNLNWIDKGLKFLRTYSTDIAAAKLVQAKYERISIDYCASTPNKGYAIGSISKIAGDRVITIDWNGPRRYPTESRGICLAALKVEGVDTGPLQ